MPKDSTGQTNNPIMEESILIDWYHSLRDAMDKRGIRMSENPLTLGQYLVYDANRKTLTDAAQVQREGNAPDDPYAVVHTLYTMAYSGNLFACGKGERFPRRVTMKDNNVVISDPIDRPKPKPLKGWRWFANKITGGWAYRQEKKAYEDYRRNPNRYWPDEKLPALFEQDTAGSRKQAAQSSVQKDSKKHTQAKPAPYNGVESFLDTNPSYAAMQAFAKAHNHKMSHEEREYLTQMMQISSQSSGVFRGTATNTEFTTNEELIERVGRCNDPHKLQDVLEGKDPVALSAEDKDFLRHRIERLNSLQKLEQNLPKKKVQGELVQSEGELWLTNVKQPDTQSTSNGCWSVSLQTQLAFRGIDLDQTIIRAVRPANQNNYNYAVTEKEYNQNTTQTITDYANLVHRVLPNTAVHTVTLSKTFVPEEKDRVALLRDMVTLAMKQHRSPVSIVYGDHYRTIYGMDENNVYVKNPLHPDKGDYEAISIKEIARQPTSQLTWLQDLTPSLDGNTPLLGHHSASSGNTYCGGKLVFNERASSESEQTLLCQTDYQTLSGHNISIESFMPDRLQYRRHKDAQPDSFCINLDALSAYKNQIAALAEKNDAYKPLHEALQDMLEQQTQTTHENLYALAQKYQSACRVSAQELENDPQNKDKQAAHELLLSQTSEMRNCLKSYLHFQNQKRIGDPGKAYLDSPEWDNVTKGMVSALHDQLVCSSVPPEDSRWLEALSPDKHAQSVDNFGKERAVQTMLHDFEKKCRVEFDSKFRGDVRHTVALKKAICGGNMLPLIREYKNVCQQIGERGSIRATGRVASAPKATSDLSKSK